MQLWSPRLHSTDPVIDTYTMHTSWPPQEKVFIWPPFFEYNKRLLRQKNGWGMLVYAPGWSLASQF